MKWSKSDQKHASSHFIPLVNMPELVLCPLKAYACMVTLIPALLSEPTFGLPHKGKLRPLSKSQIDRKFQGLIKSSGLDRSRLSFHSLRRGCASLASLAGCSDSDICTVGNWKSGCYRKYTGIHLPPDSLVRVSQRIASVCL